MEEISTNCILVIFGGTGDLTRRKLLPALYGLAHRKLLPSNYAIVAVGRRDISSDEYITDAYSAIQKYSKLKQEPDETLWNEMKDRIFYFKANLTSSRDYKVLSDNLAKLDGQFSTEGNRIFYLATAPDFFEVIISMLKENGMVHSSGNSSSGNGNPWQRIVIEKPFGSSLNSARLLNKKISEVFEEHNIYRIDHYLGKEMVQSIMGVRFFNIFFEPLWSNKYIDNIQVSACETIGIENRGEYYEKAGALGDMIQNHMLQILALLAMEPPEVFDARHIRNEKVKVLNSINNFTPDNIKDNVVLGQYSGGIIKSDNSELDEEYVNGYRQEKGVAPESHTETFAAVRITLNSQRWKGVPFYIRTGKRLATKTTDIVIQFKPMANSVFPDSSHSSDIPSEPNLLVIRIQPEEEMYIQFNTKKPGIHSKICPVKMSYCQKCEHCEAESCSPEAYEKLIADVIRGDPTLFTEWDEVEKSWEIVEKIKALKKNLTMLFPNYYPGSHGPEDAEKMLRREGRKWWNTCK